MNPKIMKLRGELEKNKGKISDLQGRNRELEKQIRELEDTDIIGMVRENGDRKSTRLNSSHITRSRMPSSA